MTDEKTIGQMLDETLDHFQSQITSLRNDTDALAAEVASLETRIAALETGGGTPEPPDPGEPGETRDRPIGLGYLPPPFDVAYDHTTDVPADALKWSEGDYLSLQDIMDDALESDVAVFLDVAEIFEGDFRANMLPVGLYGIPGTTIRFTGSLDSATPCFGYVVDQDFEMRGIRFENFGHVIGWCTPSYIRPGEMEQAWDLHGSSRSLYGTQRVIPPGDEFNGVGIRLDPDYPLVPGTPGPSVNISDCEFANCEQVFNAWSDTMHPRRVDFHRNKCTGTYGMVAIETMCVEEFYACGNSWTDCAGEREMTLKGNRFHTGFKLSINNGLDVNLVNQTVQIENNYAAHIHDKAYSDGMSAATFADIRNMTPEWVTGGDMLIDVNSVSVSFNELIDLVGLIGQEDAQPIYIKARGATIERNRIAGCGAAWYDESKDGSEVTAICIKECTDARGGPAEAVIIVRGNIIENAPPQAHANKGLTVIGTNDVSRAVLIIGNDLRGCNISNVEGGSNGLIRIYGKTAEALVIDNHFFDCVVVDGGGLIATHNWSTSADRILSEFSNNIAYGQYDEDRLLIRSTGGAEAGSATAGLNVMNDSVSGDVFDMLATGGSGAPPLKLEYTPPQVPAPPRRA
jgi:hypothetical protein